MTTQTSEPFIRDRQWTFDFVLCAVIGLLSVTPYLLSSRLDAAVLSAMLVLPLMVRRQWPAAALAVAAVAAFAQAVLIPDPLLSIVVVPILIYTVARWTSGSLGRIALLIGLVGSAIGPARWILVDSYYLGSLGAFAMTGLACVGAVGGSYLVGRRRREGAENFQQREQSEAERHALMLAEQEQRSQVITVNERNRIARELHDIVAHSLSVIVVQAEGGRALALKRPEKGPEVLGTIAETSREALEEMRRMVGLLRSGSEPEQAAYVPTPGLADIPELVRKASDTAELVAFGTPPHVSQALGLTAYRIVQESLTNVLKHAGPVARTRVITAYTATSIELEVADDGRGAAASGDGLGHGLQGMHERVALHDGTLTAAPKPGGGFVVRASLPLGPEPSIPLTLDTLFQPGAKP